MAADPVFAGTPNIGAALLGNAETSLTVPTTTSTLLTAAAGGTVVYEINVEAVTSSLTPTTVAGLVYLFTHDGSTYHLWDTITVRAITASATTAPYRAAASDFAGASKTYTNLILKTGWTLRASQSIAGNASLLKVTAIGLDA
jgi:hypothetical protein